MQDARTIARLSCGDPRDNTAFFPSPGHSRRDRRFGDAPAIKEQALHRARSVGIEVAAQIVGFTPIKAQARASDRAGPCPRCGGRDRFAINLPKDCWHCRGCGTGGDAIDLVRHVLGVGFFEAAEILLGERLGEGSALLPRVDHDAAADHEAAARQRHASDDAARRTVDAMRVWEPARHPGNTPIERHLASRGVEYGEAAGGAIRWLDDCPFGGQRIGCMVALARDVVTNEPKAVHRTALDPQGRKLSHLGSNGRLTLGPVGGCAVKLTDDADTYGALGIGEGLESTMSLRRIPEFGHRTPIWALLSAGQMKLFPVLPGIEVLWIAADHDRAGIEASEAVAARWREAGAEAFVVTPLAKRADLNDIVR